MSENLAITGFAFALIWAIYLAQTAKSRTYMLEKRIRYLEDFEDAWKEIIK